MTRFIMMLINLAIGFVQSMATSFFQKKAKSSDVWGSILVLLPVVFAQVRAMALPKAEGKINGIVVDSRLEKAYEILKKLCARYNVDISLVEDDIVQFLQNKFDLWNSRVTTGSRSPELRYIDGKIVTLKGIEL